ncbi:hypothetical protein JW766_02020 [Candidatus Dojkabacteria bacterium]|nr:hypothetical protein [Candidatus Dojkabacteria bacterium]
MIVATEAGLHVEQIPLTDLSERQPPHDFVAGGHLHDPFTFIGEAIDFYPEGQAWILTPPQVSSFEHFRQIATILATMHKPGLLENGVGIVLRFDKNGIDIGEIDHKDGWTRYINVEYPRRFENLYANRPILLSFVPAAFNSEGIEELEIQMMNGDTLHKLTLQNRVEDRVVVGLLQSTTITRAA